MLEDLNHSFAFITLEDIGLQRSSSHNFDGHRNFTARGKKVVGSKSVIDNYYPLEDGFQNFVSLGAWEQFHAEIGNYRCLAQEPNYMHAHCLQAGMTFCMSGVFMCHVTSNRWEL